MIESNEKQAAVKEVVSYYNQLKADRGGWENMWREVQRYTLPMSQFDDSQQGGSTLTEYLYDTTGINDSQEAASELLGMALNPDQRTFEFKPLDKKKEKDKKWQSLMDHVSNFCQELLYEPDFGFYTAAHEMFVEYAVFGQGHLLYEKYVDPETDLPRPRFLACPRAQMYVDVDHDKKVNVAFRVWKWKVKQLRSMFPPDQYEWPEKLKEKLINNKMNDDVEVIRAILPIWQCSLSQYMKIKVCPKTGEKYRFISTYILSEFNHSFEEKGLECFPMAIPRYMMMASEKEGRGPGCFALPALRMVNSMERDNLQAAQRQAAPPLAIRRRAFLKPLNGSPNAANYYDDLGGEGPPVFAFGMEGNPQIGFEYTEKHRQQASRIFQIDKSDGLDKAAEQREVEILAKEDRRLRSRAPQNARIITEFMSVILKLSVHYFQDEILATYDGEWPEEFEPDPTNPQWQPPCLSYKIRYKSPMLRAQNMLELNSINRVFQNNVMPLAQVDPNVLKSYDYGAYNKHIADLANFPQDILRDPEEVAQEQQQADQAAQLGVGSEVAVNASTAAKNFAQAQATVPSQTQAPL